MGTCSVSENPSSPGRCLAGACSFAVEGRCFPTKARPKRCLAQPAAALQSKMRKASPFRQYEISGTKAETINRKEKHKNK